MIVHYLKSKKKYAKYAGNKKVFSSIPTPYAGIMFRSRLEAKWAKFFDDHGMAWEYEPEAFEFQSSLEKIRYIPDFYLPEIKAFVEVKGVLEEKDIKKMRELAECASKKDIVVVLAESPVGQSFRFVQPIPDIFYSDGTADENGIVIQEETSLCFCEKCNRWHFQLDAGFWVCTACGYADERSRIKVHSSLREISWPDPCEKCEGNVYKKNYYSIG